MVGYLDLSGYPKFLRRTVLSWYSWQEICLRSRGRFPGQSQREPRFPETHQQVYCGRPPEMTNSRVSCH